MQHSQKFRRTAYSCPECTGKLMSRTITFECRDCGYAPHAAAS